MLIALFGFTVFAGLAGAIWEWANISRLLTRDHPEEKGGNPHPALTRKIENTDFEPEFPMGLYYLASSSRFKTA
jgi:hypothetical protein